MTEIKDTLERMIQGEKQAEAIVGEGEKKARAARDEAQRRASEMLAAAREDARKQAAAVVEAGVAQAKAEKAKRLEKIRQELKSLPDRVSAEHKRKAEELIVRTVLTEDA